MTKSEQEFWSDLHLLLVEPNPIYFGIIRDILKEQKVPRVLRATTGAAALKQIRESRPDALLVDTAVADMAALDLVRLLRDPRRSPAPGLPIILLSTAMSLDLVQGAVRAGVNHVLAKPITRANLLKHIASVIREPGSLIQVPTYVGPDRRRLPDATYTGPDRRSAGDPAGDAGP